MPASRRRRSRTRSRADPAQGEEHERAHHLQELRARGLEIVEIERSDWEQAAPESGEALARDVDVARGSFVYDGWRGVADFLERQTDGSPGRGHQA